MRNKISLWIITAGIIMAAVVMAYAENNSESKADKSSAIAAKKAEREAEREAKKAEWETKKAERLAAQEEKKTKTEEKKAAIEAKKTEANEKKEERQNELSRQINAKTEKRQANQAKRIQHGINKGYLTEDEINKLNSQQQNIENIQQQFNSDGKVAKDEAKQLLQTINTASLNIFSEKHDTDGKQMSVYRIGNNVKLKDEVAQKLAGEDLNKAEAKVYLEDFHRTVELKKLLNGDLSDTERAKYQDEYDNLLNKYFITI